MGDAVSKMSAACRRAWIVLLCLAACASCAAPAPHKPGDVSVALDEMKHADRNARDGGLVIFTTGIVTDGRVAKIRGKVKNTYTERVAGVRYVVALFGPDATQPMDTQRFEIDTVIDPGAEVPLRL